MDNHPQFHKKEKSKIHILRKKGAHNSSQGASVSVWVGGMTERTTEDQSRSILYLFCILATI